MTFTFAPIAHLMPKHLPPEKARSLEARAELDLDSPETEARAEERQAHG